MIYGYIRVSTEKQTVKNQQLAIRQYCKAHRLHSVVWIAETISGTKKIEKRQLGNLLNVATNDDTIIVTELSRFGRSLRIILDVLEDLLKRHVTVIAIKEGFELGDNIQSRVLAFAFGLCAEVERTLLSERTKQGLERAKKEGKQIGRRKGQKPRKYKLSGKSAYIRRERKKGRSKRSLAQELHVTRTTIRKFMRLKKIL
ncbi:MAG: recombinase family protein [Treponema sp.]|nr:recombinase family protein [Treponema sp.]